MQKSSRGVNYNRWAATMLVPATTQAQHDLLYQEILLNPERVLRHCQTQRVALGCLGAFRKAQRTHADLMRELADTARERGIPVLCTSDCPSCAHSPGAAPSAAH